MYIERIRSEKIRGMVRAARERHDLISIVASDVPARWVSQTEMRSINPFRRGADNKTGFCVFWDTHESCWKWHEFTGENRTGDVISYYAIRHGIDWMAALTTLATQEPAFPARPPLTESQFAKRKSLTLGIPPAVVKAMHNRLFTQTHIPPTGECEKPLHLWLDQGFSLAIVRKYQLGYSTRWQAATGFASLTIPIVLGGQPAQVRHRLIGASNDKYRPHQAGGGILLLNRDMLDDPRYTQPNLQRGDGIRTVLIVAGEKKAIIADQIGITDLMPVISSTGGCGAWLGRYGVLWKNMLDNYDHVLVMFDPKETDSATKTARLFGRRGQVIKMRGNKNIDDLTLEQGANVFWDYLTPHLTRVLG